MRARLFIHSLPTPISMLRFSNFDPLCLSGRFPFRRAGKKKKKKPVALFTDIFRYVARERVSAVGVCKMMVQGVGQGRDWRAERKREREPLRKVVVLLLIFRCRHSEQVLVSALVSVWDLCVRARVSGCWCRCHNRKVAFTTTFIMENRVITVVSLFFSF